MTFIIDPKFGNISKDADNATHLGAIQMWIFKNVTNFTVVLSDFSKNFIVQVSDGFFFRLNWFSFQTTAPLILMWQWNHVNREYQRNWPMSGRRWGWIDLLQLVVFQEDLAQFMRDQSWYLPKKGTLDCRFSLPPINQSQEDSLKTHRSSFKLPKDQKLF